MTNPDNSDQTCFSDALSSATGPSGAVKTLAFKAHPLQQHHQGPADIKCIENNA